MQHHLMTDDAVMTARAAPFKAARFNARRVAIAAPTDHRMTFVLAALTFALVFVAVACG